MFGRMILFAAAAVALAAQDSGDQIKVPFRDPSGAKTLKVSLQNGSVTVKGYNGSEALIETSGGRFSSRTRRPSNIPEGMHRIDNASMGLDVTEVHPATRRIKVAGPIGDLARVFGTTLEQVSSPGPSGSGRVTHRYRQGTLYVPAAAVTELGALQKFSS